MSKTAGIRGSRSGITGALLRGDTGAVIDEQLHDQRMARAAASAIGKLPLIFDVHHVPIVGTTLT